jgi:hypothetical protein
MEAHLDEILMHRTFTFLCWEKLPLAFHHHHHHRHRHRHHSHHHAYSIKLSLQNLKIYSMRMQWCYGGKVSIKVCIVLADWWKGYLWRPQLEMWFVKFCYMICNRYFTSMAGGCNHDMYCFQNVKTQVGRKPLSYFVLATPYSFCNLNFCVTACQLKKRRKGRWHRKPTLSHFAVIWYAVV